MDHATIAYGLAWVGTGAWVVCFWWMHRISARQDALLTELRELAQTQQDILREVHPDVGEIKAHVVEEQGAKINEISGFCQFSRHLHFLWHSVYTRTSERRTST
jgi:hypothetical protein